MQENLRKYLEKLSENKGTQRKMKIILTVCAVLVAVGVLGALTLPGITQEGDPICGLEEHTHTDACYGVSNTATAGDGNGEEKVFACDKEEHTHTDACYKSEASQNQAQLLSEDETGGSASVNERLSINFFEKGTASTYAGSSLLMTVVSNYSGANKGPDATISLKLGQLPEGITLAGFRSDGTKEVTITTADDNTDTKVILQFKTNDQTNESYIQFTQPQGSTLEFDLQFNSSNGIMEKETLLTLSVSGEDITGIEYNVGGKDSLPDPFILTWTADNLWDKVDKKVNNEDSNTIGVSTDNKFSGTLTYTITANSLNNEGTGEIWTDHIIVEDKLTLPDSVSLPEGAGINEDKTAIVGSDGTVILSFTELQGGQVESLAINGQEISYRLSIPNSHKNAEGIPEAEQENLSLVMELNAEQLVLPDGYSSRDAATIAQDEIKNHVKITPVPYQEYDVTPSEDEVVTTLKLTDEKFDLKKLVSPYKVGAGETIRYTFTLTNTGTTPIVVQKSDGTYYAVEDTLPKYVYMTEEQIAALKKAGATYDADTCKITWIPSTDMIAVGTTYTMSFNVTVKDAETMEKYGMVNGSEFSNKAVYKNKSAWGWVRYQTAVTTLTKSVVDASGDKLAQNGEDITYTIKVANNTKYDSRVSEIVTDTLPDALTFKSMTIGTTTLEDSGSCTLHEKPTDETAACQKEHTIEFTKDGQNLSWDIGYLAAKEVVEITYVCTVNTDLVSSKAEGITNVVKSTDKEASCTIGIDNPIKLDKSVAENTVMSYKDKSIFNYTITVTNDKDYPSTRTDLVLEDELDPGLYPYGCTLYQCKDTSETEMSWADFATAEESALSGYTFYTTINDRKVTVTRNGSNIKLSWEVGYMEPGSTYTVTYQAQINMTQTQIDSGEAYKFYNIARIDGMSDDVTVWGGECFGKIKFQKLFGESYNNWYRYTILTKDTDARWDIEFVLTGVDPQGNEITFEDGTTEMVINLKDFTNNGKSPLYEYTTDAIPVGIYTITERNYSPNGENVTQTYSYYDLNSKTVEVSGSDTVEIPLTAKGNTVMCENINHVGDFVNLQKSVYEIAKVSADGTWTPVPEKYLFSTDGEEDTYVVYNVTVSAFGEDDVQFYSMKDKLPDGLEYVGMYNKATYNGVSDFKNTTNCLSKNTFGTDQKMKMVDENNMEMWVDFRDSVNIASTYDKESNEVNFTFGCGTDTNAAVKPNVHTLHCGQAFTFLVLCKVSDDVAEGQKLTNTVELVVDKDTQLDSSYEYKMINTPYDSNQNNGDATEKEENGYKTISSSVTVVPTNTIVPGIEKNATAYHLSENKTEEVLADETNIPTSSAVRWEVKVYNDGTEKMRDYSVEDVVTPEYHFMTPYEAEKHGITSPFTYTIYKYNGEQIATYDLSSKVWETVVNDSNISTYTFDLSGAEYEIPAGGYAILKEYTYNTVDSKKIYKNTATVLPKDDFVANKVVHGELKKDSDGKYIGVTASDEVYALGEYASISWKTITEKADTSNTAKGNQSKNCISVDLKSKYVTYTNNIKNISANNFHDFVVIDLMPIINDTGVVNQDDLRGSEFRVLFDGNLTVQVLDKAGNVVAEPKYTVEFSSKTGFTENDFAGASTISWHNEWKEDDCSFRIVFDKDFNLKSQETMVISYDGKISSAATPGAIAWNSFGYQYYSSGHDIPMRAEPPKVGVMIPMVPIIQKEVIDSYDNVQERDGNIEFTFALWQGDTKLSEFTVCQGGYKELSDLVDTDGDPIKLVNGTEYTITEITDKDVMPEEYELVGIGEKGGTLSDSYTFTYYDSKDISILARNKIDNYEMKLPETGGIGRTGFKVVGTFMILLASVLCGYYLKGKNKKETRV